MNKPQNRGTRNMKIQGNMTPQNVNNHTTKNLMDSEKDETSVSKLKRMMVEQLRSLRRTSKKQVNIIKDNVDKQLDRAHKQLNVLKDNTNIQINLRKIPKRR
jgi:hypothetical protein